MFQLFHKHNRIRSEKQSILTTEKNQNAWIKAKLAYRIHLLLSTDHCRVSWLSHFEPGELPDELLLCKVNCHDVKTLPGKEPKQDKSSSTSTYLQTFVLRQFYFQMAWRKEKSFRFHQNPQNRVLIKDNVTTRFRDYCLTPKSPSSSWNPHENNRTMWTEIHPKRSWELDSFNCLSLPTLLNKHTLSIW